MTKVMTEQEMIDSLQAVWENMTMDRSYAAYQIMLVLLDNMRYLLRCDYQIDFPPLPTAPEKDQHIFFEF